MTSKPFAPKLQSARPRLSAMLQSPQLQQFTPRMIAAVQGAAVKPDKKGKVDKNKLSATVKALTGNF